MSNPRWDAKAPVVPTSSDGSVLHYPDGYLMRANAHPWVLWEPMTASLRLVGFARGRSAAYAVMEHDDGRTFPVFLTDLEDLLQVEGVVGGRTGETTWHARKRGQNYGIGPARG